MEIIEEIEIDDIENGSYFLKNSEDNIELSKLNIFVGSNNSGKSRFIRGTLKRMETLEEKISRVYVPTLRGLRMFEVDKDPYKQRTQKDYFNSEDIFSRDDEIDIFTGLEFYKRLQNMLLGRYNENKKIEDFEIFLSTNFFEGKRIKLMAPKEDNVVHIKIGKAQDHPIYDLGDGIQSIIILTFPLFENSGDQMLIGIEEPEIYLHPGMQRKLMEALLDKEGKYGFENFQYLITTHSNHFLDLTLDYPEDIKIYESKKTEDKKFEIIRRNDKNMLELMENIGVRNSSVFLANSTIWVEGITDRKYLKKYFEIYQKEKLISEEISKIYEEDKHYSFIEYSGGNITHWDFLDEKGGMASSQISNNIFLIADTDGHKDKIDDKTGELTAKAKRLVTLESNLQDGFYALEVKEIENLLTPDIIMKLIREKEKDADESIVFPEFTQREYSDIGLGEYITNNLLSGVEKPKKYKADSGTVADKVNFCNIACKHTKDIEHLSEEAKNICEKLYNFIEKANK